MGYLQAKLTVLQTRPRATHYIRFLSKEKSNHSRDPCTMALSQSVTIVTLSLVSFQTNRQDRSNYINKARENRNRKKIKKASPSIKSPMLALHRNTGKHSAIHAHETTATIWHVKASFEPKENLFPWFLSLRVWFWVWSLHLSPRPSWADTIQGLILVLEIGSD